MPSKSEPRTKADFTLRDLWSGVLPRIREPKPRIPGWPPDAFALCAYALRHASAYAQVLGNWPATEYCGDRWRARCEHIAAAWREAIRDAPNYVLPDAVSNCWATICASLDHDLSELRRPNSRIAQAMLELMAYSDQACSPLAEFRNSDFAAMQFASDALVALEQHERMGICREIIHSRLRVLPKARTPQRGLTIRSLSLFAGLVEGSEVDAVFYNNRQTSEDLTMNLLLVPWPLEMRPSQFRPNDRIPAEMGTMPEEFGFFTYSSRRPGTPLVRALRRLMKEATDDCGKVSMVVLPELALNDAEASKVRSLVAESNAALITGIGRPGVSGRAHGSNRLQLYTPGLEPVSQEKHHRWKLDRSQVVQYSLGNSLHHETSWWEHIDVSRRRLSFIQLFPWLTVCALICEDLARPDPAGDVVRAVGPNLVVALLMDGPQLISRWAARHATTLAEDPGSSVLTVTSLGMSQLSRPTVGPDRSRVIALWKEDGIPAVEIELPHDRHAAVLSVSMKTCAEWGADGRVRQSAIPALTGVRFFKVDDVPAGS